MARRGLNLGVALALAALAGAATAAHAPPGPTADARDRVYPFYMPMAGLRAPAVRLTIKCDASRAAGHEVYAGRDAASL